MFDLWNDNGKCPPEVMATLPVAVSVIVPGDIDGDCDVDDNDRNLFVAVLLGLNADPTFLGRSDLNGDGVANGLDIVLFVEALIGS